MNLLYFLAAKIFYSVGYFRGSYRIQTFFSKQLPLVTGRVRHPLGFSWGVSSRDSLSTYLTSCEAFTTKIVLSQAPNVDTFICVGANRGWYPLAFGSKNKNARIYAFECNSSIYRDLSENISKNRNQSRLSKFAIGDHFGDSNLYMPLDGNDGMSTLYPVGKQRVDASFIERVEVTTLDTCLKGVTTLGRVLLLMDIEGSEMKALRGAAQLLRDNSPVLIIEVNPEMLEESGSSAIEIFQFLRDLDYQIYWIDERGRLELVKKDNQPPHVPNLPPHSGANYLFVKSNENWVSLFI